MKTFHKFFKNILLFASFLFFNFNLYAQEHYPLEIGNRWDYKSTYSEFGYPPEIDTFSVEVIDDSLFPNNERYYMLNNWDLTGGRYVRADSNFVYYYDEYEATEDTVYRLNAIVGEEWYVQFGVTSMIRLENITTIQLFTFQTILLEYRLDGLILGYVTLSDKFGPAFFYSPGEPPGTSSTGIELIGCIIDSIEYGNPVSAEQDANNLIDFKLEQNFPNPFNPSTKIKFRIAEFGFVTLKVYDVLGNEIATLVNEQKPAGIYDVIFDGQGLKSGVYFYRINVNEYTDTKKLILLK